MKKLISLLVVAAMLVAGIVAVVPGTAADLPESDLYTHITGEISDDKTTLTMTVTLGNNPGLWCYRAFVGYNANALKLTSIENKDVWSAQEYLAGNINSNPVTYYAQSVAYNVNNTNSGVVAVYTFDILNEDADFNVNLTINPKEVFGVTDDGTKVPHTMEIINECPQYVPIDTTELDQLATDVLALGEYDDLTEDEITAMLSLYEDVHGLEGRAAAYFAESHADAIEKIDGLYAAHLWAQEKVKLDELGAKVEALPAYAEMSEAQVAEMLTLRTELAALEGEAKTYVETTYADAIARLEASYDAFMHEEGLKAYGAKLAALPAFDQMTEAQITEMLALQEELKALAADDLTYVKNTFADDYARFEASLAAYAHIEELKVVGAKVEALPAYAEMSAAQVEEMLALVEQLEAMPEADATYIKENYSDAYTRLQASYARYTRVQELDAVGARIAALPDSYYDMTEDQVAEMLELVALMGTIEDTADQQYLLDNYGDALTKLAANYVLYQQDMMVKALIERLEALPNYEEITEDSLDEVTDLYETVLGSFLAPQLKQEVPEAYDNFVNAFFKLAYGGTDAVDMDQVHAFIDAAEKLLAADAVTAEEKAQVIELLYSLVRMEEEDSINSDYIALNYPDTFYGLVVKYAEILSTEDVDYELLASLEEKILALPAYEDMTDADKAAFEEIIATIGGLSPVELAHFKLVSTPAYEAYLALYKAYEADKNGTTEPEPPVTTVPEGEDTTASAGGNNKTPQTGDNMMYIFIAAAVAAAACTVVVLIRKKKETV
ncbi:MAG: LPXTG cell wall anchor domain-containing protein [Clostridiales bacterium]|nr:LPXTG cell wall anchor domain-containing protein [Clostridiales bacterium]